MGHPQRQVKNKHFRLDEGKIKLAQQILGTPTETDTIDQALNLVIAEGERNRIVWEAQERFVESAIKPALNSRMVTECWRIDAAGLV